MTPKSTAVETHPPSVIGGACIRAVGALLVAALLIPGCQEDDPPRADTVASDSSEEEPGAREAPRAYERVLAFTTLEGGFPTGPASAEGDSAQDGPPPSDTSLVVPLFFTARTLEEGIHREIRGWVGRGNSWESFADEAWRTSSSRTPWRIVPRGPVRLVVGRGAGVESVIFRDPPRVLELDLGDELVEWTGADGSTFRLATASALVGSRAFEGLALDLTRSRDLADPPAGDWVYLVSGDSLQLVLESPTETPPGADGAFRAFGRIDSRRLQWRDVIMEWTESRAYEPARRNVPGAWRFNSSEGPGPGPPLMGSLSSRSVRLSSDGGEGPVGPVDGLFVVSGTVALGDSAYPVHGLYRHQRE